jgi:hypothetical protein
LFLPLSSSIEALPSRRRLLTRDQITARNAGVATRTVLSDALRSSHWNFSAFTVDSLEGARGNLLTTVMANRHADIAVWTAAARLLHGKPALQTSTTAVGVTPHSMTLVTPLDSDVTTTLDSMAAMLVALDTAATTAAEANSSVDDDELDTSDTAVFRSAARVLLLKVAEIVWFDTDAEAAVVTAPTAGAGAGAEAEAGAGAGAGARAGAGAGAGAGAAMNDESECTPDACARVADLLSRVEKSHPSGLCLVATAAGLSLSSPHDGRNAGLDSVVHRKRAKRRHAVVADVIAGWVVKHHLTDALTLPNAVRQRFAKQSALFAEAASSVEDAQMMGSFPMSL